ncbi:Virulence-associated protein D [Moraxella caprae]|uniref:Virulence-associated protein D n=1 Tax=Moraxella caprae TaxID=90240 RepID=A0A378QZH0_9GAMM|nr:hypothetical protein [Moraxella caprae]STZ07781.1 Virulence-associated protein D [Moraxella caprae]
MYGVIFNLTNNDETLLKEVDELFTQFGFEKSVSACFYVNQNENLETLSKLMVKLNRNKEFANVITDIKAFKISQWSDFTHFVKKEAI